MVMATPMSRLVTEGDPSARQIVRRDRDGDAIAGENSDAKLSHLAGGGGEQLMAVVEIDAKHRAWKHLADDPLDFNRFLFHSCLWRESRGLEAAGWHRRLLSIVF